MQGTRVWALVQEDPTCRGAAKPVRHIYWACALEPMRHNYWARMPQLLKPTYLEPVGVKEKCLLSGEVKTERRKKELLWSSQYLPPSVQVVGLWLNIPEKNCLCFCFCHSWYAKVSFFFKKICISPPFSFLKIFLKKCWTYKIILFSGVQHNDLTFVYTVKWSSQ